MATKPEYQEFVEKVVKAMVNHPEDVKVEKSVDEMGVILTLKTHPEDIGKVIGRKGATAQAIRTLLRTIGRKTNARISLKIEGALKETKKTTSS